MSTQRTQDLSNEDLSNEDLSNEDLTLCHRMPYIPPVIRNILMTEPLSQYLTDFITWSTLFWWATVMMLACVTWAVLYFLLGEIMLPLNDGFGIFSIAIFSYTLGWSLSYVPYLHLPPIFGMLLGGLIIRTAGIYNVHHNLDVATTSKLRTFCLTFIMIRVGLQLSLTRLKTYSRFLVILALVPSTIELFVLSICCRTILGYPWDWSLMVGTALTCMSSVVTVNCVLGLAEQGYGEDKSMASILCTAACIDDVNIVAVFVVCFTIVFGEGDPRNQWWRYLLVGLRDFVVALVSGVALGCCVTFCPHRSHKYATWHRVMGLILGSLMLATATRKVAVSAGGYLAVVIFSITSITGWKILSANFESEPYRKAAYVLWHLAQPILVAVSGESIDLKYWNMPRFGLHILCILLGLMARSIATYVTTNLTPFSWKEKLFVVVCWIPKGTLQAALAPMAFEQLKTEPDNENLKMALDVMKISVVAVFFLAPIGAFIISFSGPLLLNQIAAEETEINYLRKISLEHSLPSITKSKSDSKSDSKPV